MRIFFLRLEIEQMVQQKLHTRTEQRRHERILQTNEKENGRRALVIPHETRRAHCSWCRARLDGGLSERGTFSSRLRLRIIGGSSTKSTRVLWRVARTGCLSCIDDNCSWESHADCQRVFPGLSEEKMRPNSSMFLFSDKNSNLHSK
jgi:RNase P subunit RPR2